MLLQIQEENENLKELIQNARLEKGLPMEPVQEDADNQDELDRLEQAKGLIEKKIKEQDKMHRKEQKIWDKNIKTQEERLEGMQRLLKEKEQENRISKLKIKEMKRLMKHN